MQLKRHFDERLAICGFFVWVGHFNHRVTILDSSNGVFEFPEFWLAEMPALNFVIFGQPIEAHPKMNSTFGTA